MFLCELDGYAPAGGAVRGKPTLTLAEFDARFRTFLLDIYHRRENAETKVPPAERWEPNGFPTLHFWPPAGETWLRPRTER